MTISELEYEQANARMRRLQKSGAVVSAKYQRSTRRVVVELVTGVQLSIPADRVEGLAEASARQLENIEISPSGLGFSWPQLDVDLHVPSLLQGVLGSKKWMASMLGKSGGESRSDAKRAAARENGRSGGRPTNESKVTNLRKRASAK
jgi:hypothetical protein